MKQRIATGRIPTQLGVDAGSVVVVVQGETYLAPMFAARMRAVASPIRFAVVGESKRLAVAMYSHRRRVDAMTTRLTTQHSYARLAVLRQARRMRAIARKYRREA